MFAKILQGWLWMRCPLCALRMLPGNLLCEGCEADVAKQAWADRLCMGCGVEWVQTRHSTPEPASSTTLSVIPVRELCRVCERAPLPSTALICALDQGFPINLLLARLRRPHSDPSAARVLAQFMWQAYTDWLARHPGCGVDQWLVMPALSTTLARCQCNPVRELTRALTHTSGIACRKLALVRDAHDEVWVRGSLKGAACGLVIDILEQAQVVMKIVSDCLAQGATRVVVICAAREPSLWQNDAHVSCDPS